MRKKHFCLPCGLFVDLAIDFDVVVVRCSLPTTDGLVGRLLEELLVNRVRWELLFG
jgi:hypothetical protein